MSTTPGLEAACGLVYERLQHLDRVIDEHRRKGQMINVKVLASQRTEASTILGLLCRLRDGHDVEIGGRTWGFDDPALPATGRRQV